LKGKTLKVPYTFSYLRDENFCSRHSAPLLKPLGFVSPTVRGAKEGKIVFAAPRFTKWHKPFVFPEFILAQTQK
jgi:hypothetical protein